MDRQKDLQIKVCGMRDPLNLEQVCALLPEFVGFIFYPRSKRFVGTRPDPMLFEIPGPAIKKVGVFVDEELSQLRKTIKISAGNSWNRQALALVMSCLYEEISCRELQQLFSIQAILGLIMHIGSH